MIACCVTGVHGACNKVCSGYRRSSQYYSPLHLICFVRRRGANFSQELNKMNITMSSFIDSRHRRPDAQPGVKSVTISPVSFLRTFQVHEESGPAKLYYSSDEYEAMQAALASALQDIREWQNSGATNDLPDVTGLEGLLTPNLVRSVVVRRRDLLRSVLHEQARQRLSGDYNAEMVSLASRHYSNRSVQQARNIAALTAKKVNSEKE